MIRQVTATHPSEVTTMHPSEVTAMLPSEVTAIARFRFVRSFDQRCVNIEMCSRNWLLSGVGAILGGNRQNAAGTGGPRDRFASGAARRRGK